MASPDERINKMLQSIEEKTGLKPQVIIADIQAQNLDKHNQKIKYVKDKYGLTHGFANLLAHQSKASAEEAPTVDLLAAQYKGKEHLLPIYEEIVSFLKSMDQMELAPKKAYVSVRAKKQFALIQPSTKTRIDLGINFPKTLKVDLEPSGNFNKMVTHRVRIQHLDDFNDAVKNALKEAYQHAL